MAELIWKSTGRGGPVNHEDTHQSQQEPNERTVRQFCAAVSTFFKTQPWLNFREDELFGVHVPEFNQLHLVSMRSGPCPGLVTYRGDAGREYWEGICSDERIKGLFEHELLRDGLEVRFTSRGQCPREEIEYWERAGYRPPAPDAYLLTSDFTPGWAAAAPGEDGLFSCLRIFDAIPKVLQVHELLPRWQSRFRTKMYPIFEYRVKSSEWKLEWWGRRKIAGRFPRIGFEGYESFGDELSLRRLLKHSAQADEVWLLHHFCLHEPVTDAGSRPFYPRVCLLVEEQSGECLSFEILDPEQNVTEALRDLALDRMRRDQVRPHTIRVSDWLANQAFREIREALGFKVEPGPLFAAYEVQEHMLKAEAARGWAGVPRNFDLADMQELLPS